ncbi:MAG: HU family DNA-binding protein [Nitrospinota bacterium]
MNKSDVIDAVAKHAEIPKSKAERALDGVLQEIVRGLKRGERVVLSGFGTFTVACRKARQARNPRTGETVFVSEKKVPKFVAGGKMKEAIDINSHTPASV